MPAKTTSSYHHCRGRMGESNSIERSLERELLKHPFGDCTNEKHHQPPVPGQVHHLPAAVDRAHDAAPYRGGRSEERVLLHRGGHPRGGGNPPFWWRPPAPPPPAHSPRRQGYEQPPPLS